MTLPCELAVKSIVPAMRALVARELRNTYKMRQDEIASLLSITQPAVSQYMRSIRGRAIKIEGIREVHDIVKVIADGLVNGFLPVSKITKRYCEACRIIRKKRLLCNLHKKLEPNFNTEGCDSCIP